MVMEFAELGSLDHMPSKVAEEEMDVSNLVLITIDTQVADAMMHLNTQRARLSVSRARLEKGAGQDHRLRLGATD